MILFEVLKGKKRKIIVSLAVLVILATALAIWDTLKIEEINSEGNDSNLNISESNKPEHSKGKNNNKEKNTNQQCPSLLWSDEFSGDNLDENSWEIQLGDGCSIDSCGWGNQELQSYASSNVMVKNGLLSIEAREDDNGVYTSGRIRTMNSQDFHAAESGRLEARIKLPIGQGIWPAFWMMPTQSIYGWWPSSGEIDIMENLGHEPGRVHGTIHYGPSFDKRQFQGETYDLPPGSKFADDYHIFAVERAEVGGGGYIRWIVDDYVYATKTPDDIGSHHWPFDEEFHFILNVAVGGNWPGSPNENTVFPQTMEVDYVRVHDTPLPSLTGPNKVDHRDMEVTYQVLNAGSTCIWEVPHDATIISGQNTDTIKVIFGATSGHVKVTIQDSMCNEFLDKVISVYVTVPPAYKYEYTLENFDTVEADNGSNQLSFVFATGIFTPKFTNPQSSGINTSPLVGKYTRNEASLYDVFIYKTSSITDASDYVHGKKRFYMDVYTADAPIGSSIIIQLESDATTGNDYPIGRHSRYEAFTTTQSTWERLHFIYLDSPDSSMDDIGVTIMTIFMKPDSLTGHTYYFDNFDSYIDSN